MAIWNALISPSSALIPGRSAPTGVHKTVFAPGASATACQASMDQTAPSLRAQPINISISPLTHALITAQSEPTPTNTREHAFAAKHPATNVETNLKYAYPVCQHPLTPSTTTHPKLPVCPNAHLLHTQMETIV